MRNLDRWHIGVVEVYPNQDLKLTPAYLLDFVRWAKDFLLNESLQRTGLVNELWSVKTTLEMR